MLGVDAVTIGVFDAPMKRILVFLAGVVLSASLPAVPAAATATECSFDAGTATVTVTPLDGSADIIRRGDAIAVDGADCGAATVTDTDTIEVRPTTGDAVTIDLRGGQFAPGLTDEGDGSSEIEFLITGSPIGSADLALTIVGSAGDDTILAGSGPAPLVASASRTNDAGAVFDLNGDETVKDADVTVYRSDLATQGIHVDLKGGNDTYSGGGFLGAAPIPSYVPVALLRAGAGDDTITPGLGNGSPSIYLGDHGTDTLTFAGWDPSCFTQYASDPNLAQRGAIVCGTGGTDSATFSGGVFERLIGHAGTDFLGGTRGVVESHGRGGDDELFVGPGDGSLLGGPGQDYAIFDPLPTRIHASIVKGTANGDGHRTMTGIENLYGTSFDDRLVGDGQANVLDGADGNDTLLGKAGIDQLYGGAGVDRCDPGGPGAGESVVDCET